MPEHSATQSPEEHVCPVPQTLPQAPQLALSLLKVLHEAAFPAVAAHNTPPVAQVGRHLPDTQAVPLPQATPQAPQCGFSPNVTHSAPHFVFPSPQTSVQALLMHSSPAPHLVPQAPQWSRLLVESTQALVPASEPSAQAESPGPHVVVQAPSVQTWSLPQTVPQAPQCFGSLLVKTQELPQAVRPSRQVSTVPVKGAVVPHAASKSPITADDRIRGFERGKATSK